MIGAMKPTWLIVAAASAMVGLPGCGGKGFTVAGDGSGSGDGAAVGTPDAEAGIESGPGDAATADESPLLDATVSDATSSDASAEGPDEASARDAGPSRDAEWVPDVVEPAPSHCDNGFGCTPPPPDGWSGPLEVYSGPTPPAACSPNFEGPVFVGGTAAVGGAATCGCTCGNPAGVGCAAVDVPFFSGLTCPTGGACAQKTFAPGVCTHNDAASQCDAGTTSMIIPLSAATDGMCLPVATKTVSTPTWVIDVRACVSGL